MRHLFLPFTTGDWQGVPLRVRAPHRGAWCKAKGSRVVRCMGLSAIFLSSPTPRLGGDVADDCLASGVDVDMFDANGLLTAAAQFCQCLGLHDERPQ